MILGIGVDICRIDRIRRSLNRFGSAWIEELFTEMERASCLSTSDAGLAFARTFCGKEACAKALGTGFANRVNPRDIELATEPSGSYVQLHRAAHKRARFLTPVSHKVEFVLSIGDDDLVASALAIFEAVPR